MSVKVIAFNGPPRSGKDTVVAHLVNNHPEMFFPQRFAQALKEGAHGLLGLPPLADEYEDQKDAELPEFFGMKPRNWYIHLSENVMKPLFGIECFGHIWLRLYRDFMHDTNATNAIALIPDCGFREELRPLIQTFGIDNVWLVRIYRAGCDFSSDSRDYVRNCVPNELELVNINDEPHRICEQAEHLLERKQVFADFYRRTSA